MRALFTDRPTFFTWVRDRTLAASGRPSSKEQVDWLKKNGVTSILTLTEEPLPEGWTAGIDSHHVPLRDHAPPTHPQMLVAADLIASEVSRGKTVLVHCLAGKGRTGCVLAAYLMLYEGRSARGAIDELRSTRGGSVEGPQEGSVIGFEQEALKAGATRPPRPGTIDRRPP